MPELRFKLFQTDRISTSTGRSATQTAPDPISIAIVLTLHLALIIPIAWTSSPNCDELAHLASGIHHWQLGRFDAYRVNPPLHRMWCTIPLVMSRPRVAWRTPSNSDSYRSEWCLVGQLLDATSPQELRLYLVGARLMGLPIVVLGGISSYLWAHRRYGAEAALATLILWCFSPNVLSWGATLCPDVAGAAIGICASYTFSRWLVNDDWLLAVTCGVLQGLCILTKSTWILLFITSPLLILGRVFTSPNREQLARCVRGVALMTISLSVINLGYGLERTGTPLGEYSFQSQLFRRMQRRLQSGSSFLPMEGLPVPLPFNFITGVDQQRHEFEQGKQSYLLGRWRSRGWYEYYVVCAALKMPLGFWLLALWAAARVCSARRRRSVGSACKRQELVKTLALWIPFISLACMVSSQNGFSRHFRYIFPCLPFAFIVAGQGARVDASNTALRFVGLTSIFWFAASSVSTWPLCHSYFNELAGGPFQGYRFLLDSNVDWGEDILRAEQWLDQHPAASPVYRGFVTDEFAAHRKRRWQHEPPALQPGWYMVSIHRVMNSADRFSIMRQFQPVDRIGYSTLVYHVRAEDIQRAIELEHPQRTNRG